MNTKARINLKMNLIEAIIALSEGNPGAVTVCSRLVKEVEHGIITLCHLDDMEIYGSDIWLCYKDICKMDINLLLKRIRSREIKKELEELKKKYVY